MTGTTMEAVFEGTASDLVPNTVLAKLMHKNLVEVGVPTYDEADQQYAKQIQATLTAEDMRASLFGLDRETAKQLKDKAIADVIGPLSTHEFTLAGSTDVGDVSWQVPTMQCMTTCWALGTPFHTWQVVSQGAMPIAHKGMLQAGKVMAATAIEAMENPALIEQAKAELQERLEGEEYFSLIPDDVQPPQKA